MALIIRSGPFSRRSARSQLDMALAAASLEIQLELFFIGPGVLQIITGGEPAAAGLPSGLKAWKSVAELTEVKAWVPDGQWPAIQACGQPMLLNARPLAADEMRARWAGCDRALVI